LLRHDALIFPAEQPYAYGHYLLSPGDNLALGNLVCVCGLLRGLEYFFDELRWHRSFLIPSYSLASHRCISLR
jgi:hypothetical protein